MRTSWRVEQVRHGTTHAEETHRCPPRWGGDRGAQRTETKWNGGLGAGSECGVSASWGRVSVWEDEKVLPTDVGDGGRRM